MTTTEATVLWGANNIFTVRLQDQRVLEHLRLKGKILDDDENTLNPLAPGDRVRIGEVADRGYQIVARLPRTNAITRWNRKRSRMQVIAANIDRLYLVVSRGEPDYPPQFIDRVLVMTELEEIDCEIVVNKADLPVSPTTAEHITALQTAGYRVHSTNAAAGTVGNAQSTDGVTELARSLPEGTVALFGRSGVGKSSLINALVPGADLRIASVSHRYNRGRHTTTLARQVIATTGLQGGTGTVFVDTPGIQEYPLDQYDLTEIAAGFREFRRFIPLCRMPSCTHLHEPGCTVREAVELGEISSIRYGSYTRIAGEVRRIPG
ncbi:MAG: ribosome small subunit-dependent GTPase A [Alkalispirochaeta sp.]